MIINMKKIWIVIGIVGVALAIVLIVTQTKKESEVIKIGAILPLTGDAAQWGSEAKKAIELGIAEVNEEGGIKGKKIKVIFEDSQLDPKVGTNAIRKLISVDKVPAIIGAISSSVTLAIAPIAEANEVILISPASTSHKITKAGDYIFRTIQTDIYEGSFMAEFAFNKLKYKKISVITVNAAGTKSMSDAFAIKFKALGGKIPSYELIPQGGTDFRSQIAKMQKAKYDAIYLVGFPLETGLVLKQAREMGISQQFLSAQPAEDPQVREIAGNAAEGLIFTTTTVDPATASNATKEFMRKFRARWGKNPGVFSYESYDAFCLIIQGIKQDSYSSKGIKTYLYDIKNYDGVSGNMSFDNNGDVIKSIRIVKIKDGKFQAIK